jgi:hypothetical protein
MDAHHADLKIENGPKGGAIFTTRFLRVDDDAGETASAA